MVETGPQGLCQLPKMTWLAVQWWGRCLATVVQVLMVWFSGTNETHRRIKWAAQGHRTQSRGYWSFLCSVSGLLPPYQPPTGLTFFSVFWWSLYLAPLPPFSSFHFILSYSSFCVSFESCFHPSSVFSLCDYISTSVPESSSQARPSRSTLQVFTGFFCPTTSLWSKLMIYSHFTDEGTTLPYLPKDTQLTGKRASMLRGEQSGFTAHSRSFCSSFALCLPWGGGPGAQSHLDVPGCRFSGYYCCLLCSI